MSNLQEVIDRAKINAQFRSRLKANPVAACQEADVEIPAGAKVNVIENNQNDIHVVLGARTNVPALDQIAERAEKDPAFKKQLLSDPKAAIEAATGMSAPANSRVHVHEVDQNQICIFLPDPQSADGELSESELAGVAGGNPFFLGMIIGTALGGGAAIATIAVQNTGTLKGLDPSKKPKKPA